jgi:molybdopterin/thiamine biosynthesis adenylyltransferase
VLSDREYQRYSRHMIIPEFGVEGQKRLKRSKVLIVGAGGLGAPLGFYLTAAGVGRLALADADVVDLSNLQRQVLFDTDDIGRQKCSTAVSKLQKLNPDVEIVPVPVRLGRRNVMEILSEYDVIADATDNFPSRYLINDACSLLGKPCVHGSVLRFQGQATVFSPGGPCYRCLYPSPPPSDNRPGCAETGVLGVLPAIIGSIQAAEVIKLLTGNGRPLAGWLLLVDAWDMRFRELKVNKDPRCAVCGLHPAITEITDHPDYNGA